MSYSFFQNALENGLLLQPHQAYYNLQQAFVNQQWDNTVAMNKIEEQDLIGDTWDSFTFHPIEVWIDYVVGESSRGTKTSEDFASLIFRDLNYRMFKGRYYKFDNNFWISYFENKYNGITKAMAVRRCNNFMRIVDPMNGGIYTVPCVIDYDMASPSNQIGKDIITPNNHAVVMVQGNSYTKRLFKTNTRYIFNGRPFKLAGYQNTINNDYFDNESTLLYLDLYLDEIHAEDDLENQIADNGNFDYVINIENDNQFESDAIGNFTASVVFNGIEVEREIVWYSGNKKVIEVEENGSYHVVGEPNSVTKVCVKLADNPEVNSQIEITVVEQEDLKPSIIIDPMFSTLRECETIQFTIFANYGGQEYHNITSQVSLNETEEILANENVIIEKNENTYTLSCLRRLNIPQYLYVRISNADPEFSGSEQFKINLVSLMG